MSVPVKKIWRTSTSEIVLAQVPTERCICQRITYTCVKHCVGAGGNGASTNAAHLAYTGVKHCVAADTHGMSANAAAASNFAVHLRDTCY